MVAFTAPWVRLMYIGVENLLLTSYRDPFSAVTAKSKSSPAQILAYSSQSLHHYRRLAPELSKAAESLSPLIEFYNVDCDEDANKQYCSQEGVKGYPTIKVGVSQ